MSERKEFRDLATPEEAHEAIASLNLAGGVEHVPLESARGRVLGERIDAEVDVPGFDRASMDGYAVRARDTFGASADDPVELAVTGTVHAGEEPTVTVGTGETAEISTGAVMPDGADAVAIVERTHQPDAGTVAVERAVTPGENVMFAGADVAAGERALGPGTVITPREVGLLAALGVESVPVRSRPTVGVVSTGEELVRPGNPLDSDAGQIYDVNSDAVAAAVEEAGGDPVMYPHAGDDTGELERVLSEAAAECDLVLSSGSTSASAVDVVYRVVERRGELLLHGVAIKPGKPMLVGRLDASGSGAGDGRNESAYVGLPGYPVSAMTIFRTFVAPAIREAAGLPEPASAIVAAEMATEERFEEGRRRLVPVGLVEDGDGDRLAYGVDKGSGATTSLTDADGVVDVPADVNYLAAGESVTVDLFSADVRTAGLLGAGEDDPALARALDLVDRPRYRTVGSEGGLRWLRDGVADVAVVAGPVVDPPDAAEIGRWEREWGLVVPPGNPEGVSGLADLVDREIRLVNRPTASGLRTGLDEAFAALADERGTTTHGLTETVAGFGVALRAVESPARTVAAGDADAGLGLRATAAKLDLGFVSVDTQTVRALAAPNRRGKPSVAAFEAILDGAEAFEDLPGYGG